MKLLYAIQGTGNGHLARASEIAPALAEVADVDFLISGKSAELNFPFPFNYNYHGLYFIFGNRGGVNYLKSLRQLRPFKLLSDIRSVPVHKYDAVINDYETITAHACRRHNIPVIGVSHQSSFYSDKVPMPSKRRRLFEYGMRHWVAPSDGYVGLHYKPYDDHILPPIIRPGLVEASLSDEGHITVYLPAFSDERLVDIFKELTEVRWEVFTKKSKEIREIGNVLIHPVDKKRYSESLINCHGLLTGGGFQATAEGLYLSKKMMVIPMFDQYEQKCNAAALKQIGVPIVYDFDQRIVDKLRHWIKSPYNLDYLPIRSDISTVAKKILEVSQQQIDKKVLNKKKVVQP